MIKERLALLDEAEQKSASDAACRRVCSLECFADADTILSYMSAGGELSPLGISLEAMRLGKRLALPRVIPGTHFMDFYTVDPALDLDRQLECGKWGIREPFADDRRLFAVGGSLQSGGCLQKDCGFANSGGSCKRDVALQTDAVFQNKPFSANSRPASIAVIVPGVAFGKDGTRLGHGMGFYDNYLAALKKACAKTGSKLTLIGFCHTAQIVQGIPTDPHDIAMDMVCTPEEIIPARAEAISSIQLR